MLSREEFGRSEMVEYIKSVARRHNVIPLNEREIDELYENYRRLGSGSGTSNGSKPTEG